MVSTSELTLTGYHIREMKLIGLNNHHVTVKFEKKSHKFCGVLCCGTNLNHMTRWIDRSSNKCAREMYVQTLIFWYGGNAVREFNHPDLPCKCEHQRVHVVVKNKESLYTLDAINNRSMHPRMTRTNDHKILCKLLAFRLCRMCFDWVRRHSTLNN